MPIPPGQRRIVGHPQRAVRLNGAIEDPLQRIRHEHLDVRDLFAGRLLSVPRHARGSIHHHQSRRMNLDARIRNPELHLLPVGQHVARRQFALHRAPTHQVEGALADPDPAHTVMNTSRSKALLRQGEPVPL